MSELHVVRPFVPDVARCMVHFNAVMRLLLDRDTTAADLYLTGVKADDGEQVYATVMRMLAAAHDES
ncbi:hypothetical protein [Umezawaea sp. Da 62-37]|uniref:hypothetical protein n=1 Tax=Umezawaea sp. Da 62-37 TaxID=3075927 RepID=UPI0028F6C2F3|nr:hypothetical protein [Umezawaea sp. Da 62-37]WNV89029.1 hypothetical protein RM788_12220 [Umezawaea sp. Da 62-37]